MNRSSFIREQKSSIKKTPTLVRRVSDMFRDGAYSGPPSLFSQKIRHCCQNLNLLPYLLYSFENSKSHPLAKKVNMCFDLILKNFIEQLFSVYSSLRQITIYNLQQKWLLLSKGEVQDQKDYTISKIKFSLDKLKQQKPRESSVFLKIAIYLTPIFLAFQLLSLCNLLLTGKYTPGFIFLVSACLFLGFISTKILFHDALPVQRKREECKKSTEKRKHE